MRVFANFISLNNRIALQVARKIASCNIGLSNRNCMTGLFLVLNNSKQSDSYVSAHRQNAYFLLSTTGHRCTYTAARTSVSVVLYDLTYPLIFV